jgi:phosphoglycolate phosphatase
MTGFPFDPPIPFEVVGFDLDGTLLDTADDLTAAINHTLSLAGRRTLLRSEALSYVGGGVQQLIRNALAATGGTSPDLEAELLPRHSEFYLAHLTDRTRPFPGAVAAIDTLVARGVRLAVVTNKREAISRALLAHFDLLDRFAVVIGGDTLGPERMKPKPDPLHEMAARAGGGRAAFIGDSRFDVAAAKAAGMPVVACAFGFAHEPIETLGADAIIAHFDDLVPTLERL